MNRTNTNELFLQMKIDVDLQFIDVLKYELYHYENNNFTVQDADTF